MADYASVLREQVTLRVRCVDRIFIQAWVAKLQSVGLICRFLLDRGYRIPSSAVLGKIGDAYVRRVHGWAKPTTCRWCISRRARTKRPSPVHCWPRPPGRAVHTVRSGRRARDGRSRRGRTKRRMGSRVLLPRSCASGW
jgi:hypothetical protein